MNKVITVMLVCAVLALTGCVEEQKKKVWGQGELPADWQSFFGNSNTARLDFKQTQLMNLQGAIIGDPNNGIVANIKKFEALNSEQHLKLGRADISFHERIEALEVKIDTLEKQRGIALTGNATITYESVEELNRRTHDPVDITADDSSQED